MQQVTKFKAIDGRLFDSSELCEKHEGMLLEIDSAMKQLRPIPKNDGCHFANGGGYVQQEMLVVHEAMRKIVGISGFRLENSKENFLKNPFPYRNSISIIGRYLSDGDNNAAYSAWVRFMCMDDLYREWGQPYFADNPSKGEQKEARAEHCGTAA